MSLPFPRVRLTVIGTGYLGLTHAVCMAELGHEVLAIDVDPAKVARAASGEPPFFEPGLEPLLRKNLEAGRLRFTTSYCEVSDFGEVHFLCVGTPESADGSADLQYLYAAIDALAPHLSRRCLVVGKSTVPVGTARRLTAGLRERSPVGEEIELAWNPEFLREGTAVQDTMSPDRMVFGVTLVVVCGPAARRLCHTPVQRNAVPGHGPGNRGTGQGGSQLVPGDEDLVHQRHG